jgi:exodeoxyribonuclease V alpha subunit
MPTIYGLLERISYHNEENDFVVAKLREKEKKEVTTIVGNLSGINLGESLKLTGKWVHNKRFGEQFQVETFEVTVPATLLGIQKYLASGLIKGIGPIMAERIVKKFALDTLEIIEKKSERLSEVEGIGPKRIAMITKAWEEQKEIKEIMIFLQGHGVSAAYSAKIYKQYANQSIEIVRENPYRLAHDIHGIGFITADKIAQNLGIDRNSVIRAKAGLIYVLNQLTEEGHVYYPEPQLIYKAKEILNVDEEIVILAVKELSREKDLFLEDLDPDGNLRAVFLAPFYVAETGIAQRLKKLKESHSNIRPINPEKAIEWVQQKLNIELAERHKEAVLLAANPKVLIITGGPGTGKTTIIFIDYNHIKCLYNISNYKAFHLSIPLLRN